MIPTGNDSVVKARLVEFSSPVKPPPTSKRSILSPRLIKKKDRGAPGSPMNVVEKANDESERNAFGHQLGNSSTTPFSPVNYRKISAAAGGARSGGVGCRHGVTPTAPLVPTAPVTTVPPTQPTTGSFKISGGRTSLPLTASDQAIQSLLVCGSSSSSWCGGAGSNVGGCSGAGVVPPASANLRPQRITGVTATANLLPSGSVAVSSPQYAASESASASSGPISVSVSQERRRRPNPGSAGTPTAAPTAVRMKSVNLGGCLRGKFDTPFSDSVPPTAHSPRTAGAHSGQTQLHTPHSLSYCRRSASPVQSIADSSPLEQLSMQYATTLMDRQQRSPSPTNTIRSASPTYHQAQLEHYVADSSGQGRLSPGGQLEYGLDSMSTSGSAGLVGSSSAVGFDAIKRPDFIGFNVLRHDTAAPAGSFVPLVSRLSPSVPFVGATHGPAYSGVDAGESRHAVSVAVAMPSVSPLMRGGRDAEVEGAIVGMEGVSVVSPAAAVGTMYGTRMIQAGGNVSTSYGSGGATAPSIVPAASTPSSNIFRGHPNDLLLDHQLQLSEHARQELLAYHSVYYYDKHCVPAIDVVVPVVPVAKDESVKGAEGDSKRAPNNGYDDEEGHYKVSCCESGGAYVQGAMQTDSHIDYRYQLCQYIGCGTFSKIYRGIDHKHQPTSSSSSKVQKYVAIKIIRNIPGIHKQAAQECEVLYHIQQHTAATRAPSRGSIGKLLNSFEFRSHFVLIMSLYGMNLHDYMKLLNTLYISAVQRRQRRTEALQAQRQSLTGYAGEQAQAKNISTLKNKQKLAAGDIIIDIAPPTGGQGCVGAPSVVPTEAVQLISLKQIKSIASQVLGALALLKSIHVIHADIKPQNICIKNPAFVQYLVDQFALPGVNPAEGGKGKSPPFTHTALEIEVVLIDFSCSCYEDEKYKLERRRFSFKDGNADEYALVDGRAGQATEAVTEATVKPETDTPADARTEGDSVLVAVANTANKAGDGNGDCDGSGLDFHPVGFELECGSAAPVIDDDSGILFFNHQHTAQTDPVARPPPEIATMPELELEPGVPHPPQNKYIQSRCYRAPEVLLECPYNCSIDMFGLSIVLMELYLCGNSSIHARPGDNNYSVFGGVSEEAQIRLYASLLDYKVPQMDDYSDAYEDLLLRSGAISTATNDSVAVATATATATSTAISTSGGHGREEYWLQSAQTSIPPSLLEHCSEVKKSLWFESSTGGQRESALHTFCWRPLEETPEPTGFGGGGGGGNCQSNMHFQTLRSFLMQKKQNVDLWLHRSTLSENLLSGCGESYNSPFSGYGSPSSPESMRNGQYSPGKVVPLKASHDICQFVSFLELLFTWAPHERIAPGKATRHPWFNTSK